MRLIAPTLTEIAIFTARLNLIAETIMGIKYTNLIQITIPRNKNIIHRKSKMTIKRQLNVFLYLNGRLYNRSPTKTE